MALRVLEAVTSQPAETSFALALVIFLKDSWADVWCLKHPQTSRKPNHCKAGQIRFSFFIFGSQNFISLKHRESSDMSFQAGSVSSSWWQGHGQQGFPSAAAGSQLPARQTPSSCHTNVGEWLRREKKKNPPFFFFFNCWASKKASIATFAAFATFSLAKVFLWKQGCLCGGSKPPDSYVISFPSVYHLHLSQGTSGCKEAGTFLPASSLFLDSPGW